MAGDLINGEIPDHWEFTTLGEICQRGGGNIQTGPFGSQLHASDYVPVGVPSIMPTNIGENRIVEDGIVRITEEDANRLGQHRLRAGDIVYSRRGDVEKRALIREREEGWFCGTGCLKVRLGSGVVDPLFASLFLGHPAIREWIVRHAVGATMPNLNTTIMSAVPFALPPLAEQKAIAAVLGALDDKIELNRRMNATLEAMARALFQSWFVDFDPVRAKLDGRQPVGMDAANAALFPAAFQSSQSGPIPAGWGHTTLAEFCSKITDGAHQSPKSVDAGFPMASVKDMTDWEINIPSCRHISEVDYKSLVANGCQPELGDILLAKDGATCLDTACEYQQTDKIVLLSSVAILRPKYVCDSAFLHTWLGLSSTKTYLKENFVSGSAIPRVVLRDMKRATFISPPRNILNAFSHAAAPLREQIRHNHEQSRTLATLRDTLLPKLLSGELSVAEAMDSMKKTTMP